MGCVELRVTFCLSVFQSASQLRAKFFYMARLFAVVTNYRRGRGSSECGFQTCWFPFAKFVRIRVYFKSFSTLNNFLNSFKVKLSTNEFTFNFTSELYQEGILLLTVLTICMC